MSTAEFVSLSPKFVEVFYAPSICVCLAVSRHIFICARQQAKHGGDNKSV